jgi:hypothetical protein
LKRRSIVRRPSSRLVRSQVVGLSCRPPWPSAVSSRDLRGSRTGRCCAPKRAAFRLRDLRVAFSALARLPEHISRPEGRAPGSRGVRLAPPPFSFHASTPGGERPRSFAPSGRRCQASTPVPPSWSRTTSTVSSAWRLRACCIPLPALGFAAFSSFSARSIRRWWRCRSPSSRRTHPTKNPPHPQLYGVTTAGAFLTFVLNRRRPKASRSDDPRDEAPITPLRGAGDLHVVTFRPAATLRSEERPERAGWGPAPLDLPPPSLVGLRAGNEAETSRRTPPGRVRVRPEGRQSPRAEAREPAPKRRRAPEGATDRAVRGEPRRQRAESRSGPSPPGTSLARRRPSAVVPFTESSPSRPCSADESVTSRRVAASRDVLSFHGLPFSPSRSTRTPARRRTRV